MIRIILASSSPRRQELLQLLGWKFEIIKPDVEEQRQSGEAASNYAMRNAASKKDAVLRHCQHKGLKETLIIAADTIVCIDDLVLEKPADRADCERMLSLLSGREHIVRTAVSLHYDCSSQPETNFLCETRVQFKQLAKDEIESYSASTEPYDKAGGYAAQGYGSYMIAGIHGSYSNVIGLPICALVTNLREKYSLNAPHGLT